MPIQFRLNAARVGEVGSHPWGQPFNIPGPGGSRALEDVILSASHNEVVLTPSFGSGNTAQWPTLSELWPIDLHEALETVCANPPGQFPIPHLGLIFGSRYAPRPGVFGAMFDTGFVDADQAGIPISFRGVPREGCAVFIEAIRDRRPGTAADPTGNFDRQVAFTTIHELGHIFNLQHTNQQSCFLDTSPAGNQAPPVGSFRFLTDHRNDLRVCATDNRVCPGGVGFGSAEYLDSGRAARAVAPPAGLHLEIRPSQPEFFRWEPVELEITLALRGESAPAAMEIPDEIDPGYPNFIIWITDPSGERRRYRSAKHYCASTETQPVTRRKPFQRDLSIFGQSGGFTFHYPGIHWLSAEFRLPGGAVLRAEPVPICVLPEMRTDSRARRRHEELRDLHRKVSSVLFYRSGKFRPTVCKALDQLIDRSAGSPLSAAAQYALGRWLSHQAARSKSTSRAVDWKGKARDYLLRARDSKWLDRHRRTRADEYLKQ
jgi:hypothetical protein